ncbi:hypothetical protein D3C81_11790 [compost metagenome]
MTLGNLKKYLNGVNVQCKLEMSIYGSKLTGEERLISSIGVEITVDVTKEIIKVSFAETESKGSKIEDVINLPSTLDNYKIMSLGIDDNKLFELDKPICNHLGVWVFKV